MVNVYYFKDYSGLINWKASAAMGLLTDRMKQGTPYLQAEMPDCETVKQFEDRIINFFQVMHEILSFTIV